MAGEEKNRKPHILLTWPGTTEPYTSPRTGRDKSSVPQRERQKHAKKLLKQLDEAAKKRKTPDIIAGLAAPAGQILEFQGELGHQLRTDSLEMRGSGIELLSVKRNRDRKSPPTATVYVPHGKLEILIRKVEAYATEDTPKGKPKNGPLIESLSEVRRAALGSLWTDAQSLPDIEQTHRLEVWLRKDNEKEPVWAYFQAAVKRAGLHLADYRLSFPEREVTEVIGTLAQLASNPGTLNCLAEIRYAREIESFFHRLEPLEKVRWLRDLEERTEFTESTIRVSLLDTGVNRGHRLLQNIVSEESVHTHHPAWGTHDHHGHGTEMAGLVLYGDLTEQLSSNETFRLEHGLESVKILPPEELPGASKTQMAHATSQAVSRLESMNPDLKRVFFTAVSETDCPTGRPSAWSATVDKLSYQDEDETPNEHRLFVVSGGNTSPASRGNYPKNLKEPIHSPGQAWNALTIGAYTQKAIVDNREEWRVKRLLAKPGTLSASSSSSLAWGKDWPFKPDVVFEGGNQCLTSDDTVDFVDGLNLLTTSRVQSQPFTQTGDTSAAGALAARFAAQVWSRYPDFWPETVRALVVHSAEWPSTMEKMIKNLHSQDGRRKLLRLAGYGVPDLSKALWSASNSLTLIVENSLHPFGLAESGSLVTKELRLHELPWPRDVLEGLGETEVSLRVTLSYFVEPNPGERGWTHKRRYPSHGLRFDLKTATESTDEFKARINKAARDEDDETSYKGDSNEWKLGFNLRTKGCICSDTWTGTAADLASRNHVAVYPVSGWWKERKYLKRWDREAYYTLVVTIETPSVETDIYTPVVAQIEATIQIDV